MIEPELPHPQKEMMTKKFRTLTIYVIFVILSALGGYFLTKKE